MIRSAALRYALAPACIGLAALLHVSPVGALLHPMGLFILGVVAAAWFGGAGPGVLAAFLSAISLPHLIAITYPLSVAYPLLASFFDLPRFVTLGLTGAAVGWGASSYRRVRDKLETVVAERTAHLGASQEALRRSEERLARALDASNDGIWDWDLVTHEQFFSERAQRILGLKPGRTVRPRSEWDALREFHPDDKPRRLQAIERHLAGETPAYEGEWRVRPAGGFPAGDAYRWVHTRGVCTRDAAGRPVRMIGSITDIDARKRAEGALRLSEERYAVAMEVAEEGHFDWNVQTDEIFSSPQALTVLGLPQDTGYRTRAEVMARMRVHPDDGPRISEQWRAALAGRGAEHEFEYRILRGAEPRSIRSRWKIFRDEAGVALRVIGVLADITARKLAEEARRLSEERYALAMEAAGDGHTDWNLVTGEFYISPRLLEILGYAPDTTFADRADWVRRFPFHPDDRPRWEAAVAAHLAGREAKFKRDWRIVVRGETRWVAFTFIATRDASGKPVRWTGSIADITERKLAADELRESEARFRALTELSSDAYWAQDENLRFVPTGSKRDLAGYPADEHMGKTRWELSNATPLSGTWAEHEAVLQARKSFRDFEYRRVGPEGAVRYLSISGAPIFDEQDRFRGYQGVGRDITERKRMEEEVRESEARFRALTELSSDWYWEQDENLRFVYLSNQALALTGYSGESSVGKTRWEIANMTPLSCTWEEHKAVLAARQPFRDLECRRVGPDGTVRYLSMSGAPVFDEGGRFKGYQGIGRNITERKRAEEKLRESEALKSAMFETALDCIISIDHDGRVIEFNPAAESTFGYRRAEAMGKELADLIIPPRLREQHRRGLARYLASGEGPVLGTRVEMPAVRADGSEFPVELSVNRIPTEGAPLFTAYLRDITARKRADEAVRESEARFRSLTELSSDWYWRQDDQFRFTYTSRQPEETGAYPSEWVIDKTRWELPGITPLSFTWPEHQAALAARQPFRDLEYARVGLDGTHYVSISGAPIFDDQGVFRGYQGIGRDITARKSIEEELRSRQEMLELAQKSARAVAFEWRIGAEGPYRDHWSPELAAMYGVAPDAYDGSFQQWKKLIHPEDWPAVKEAIKHALRTGDVATEYRVVHPDGSVHWLHARGRMFFDAAGKPARMLGFMHDVTERRQAEEDLRSRQEMLQLAQQSARAVAFGWRADREQPWPPELEAMYGVAPGTFRGTFHPPGMESEGWKKVVHRDDWQAVSDAIKHSYRTGEILAEYRVVQADGSVRWLQCKGRMFLDAEKKPLRVVGLIQDVTQLRQAEQELKTLERKLRQAQRLEAMGTLAGGIAHDFNNILGAILGYGEMALRDAPKGSRLARDLDSIVVAGERGRALVDRVLAFSRSGVGERASVHVEKVVREALDFVSAKLPPDITLHAKLHAGRAAMLGDATQVHQVLMNLATNAVQAMPAGGTLRVSLRAVRLEAARAPTIGILDPGDYLVLEVADTGSGIAPEILERIFDPFFTTKEVGTGTGLGLSLVHGIVTEVGGAIDVASKPGAGSTFTVYLPRSGEALDTSEEEEPDLPRGDGQRVLVVDDEEPLVRLATRTLEELGYAPVGFTSSTKALAAFRADPQRFDALITDERMPGMSGSALIREVRGIRDRIPVVLMSGFVGGAVASRAREAGAEEVLKKPLSARDLAASLAKVLHSSH